MAALTWRDVQAPDFRGSMAGLAQANSQLNEALSGASRTLANWDKSQNEGTNQQVLLNALQYTDPAAYNAALQSGSLTQGVDPKRLSAGTLQTLGSRAGDLLQQASTGQRLESANYAQNRLVSGDAALDGAREGVAALTEAYRTGDQGQIQQVQQRYGDQLAKLQPQQLMDIIKGGQSIQGGTIRNSAAGFENMTTQRNDAEGRQATDLATSILRSSTNPDEARSLLEGTEMPAAVRAKVNGLLEGRFPGIYGALGTETGGLPTSAPGASGTRAGNPYDVTVGFQATPTPISGMTMGQAVDYGEKTLIPATRGREDLGLPPDLGSSAVGPFQITSSTLKGLGPKVFGDGWKDTPMTAENQDKLAKQLFEDRKDGNLASTWTSLPNKAAGAYKDVPWEEMRNIIAKGEVGVTLPPSTKNQTRNAVTETGQRFMQNTQQAGAAVDLLKNLTNTAAPYEVVNELTKDTGPFAGGDKGRVTDIINRTMRDAGVNAKQAGAMLARNVEAGGWVSNLRGLLGGANATGNITGDLRINDNALQKEIADQREGRTGDIALAQEMTGEQIQTLGTAQSAYEKASAAYVAAQRRAETQPGFRQQLPRYQRALQEAKQMLDLQTQAQRSQPQYQARRIARPVNEPVQQSYQQRDATVEIPRYKLDQFNQD